MTTEEKLSAFYMNCLTSATEEARRQSASHKAALEEMYQEHVRQKRVQSEAELAVRKEEMLRESNRALSEAQLKVRREYSARSQELRDALFRDVEKKLAEFKQTPAYIDYICKKVNMALHLSSDRENDILVYMDASDAGIIKEVSSRCGIRIREAEEPILGGVRAVIPSRQILIDFAFRDMLEEEKNAFSFRTCMSEGVYRGGQKKA